MKIENYNSPNYRKDRRQPIDLLVIHYTGDMSIDSTIFWFMNPSSKVSAHYLIGRDGRTLQFVCEKDEAWHAGASSYEGKENCNQYSIGVELVGTEISGFTDEQYNYLIELTNDIKQKYPAITTKRIVGHEHIAPGRKIDPGKLFDWDRLLRGISPVIVRESSEKSKKTSGKLLSLILLVLSKLGVK